MRATLTIETSTDAASIALVLDGQILVEKSFVSNRRHNSLLFQPLAEMIEETGHRTFERVLVGSGPGSYSGTRVGIAAAQGAALAAGCRAIALPSLLAVEPVLTLEPCLAVGDARRGNYWIANFKNGKMLHPPTLTDRIGFDTAIKQARETDSPIFTMTKIPNIELEVHRPNASGLWKAWQIATSQERAAWTAAPPKPIYITPPNITPSKKRVFGAGAPHPT